MSLDNDLKKAFERHSLEQNATPEAWAGIEHKVRRSHRRQALATGVLTVALLVGAASVVPMFAGTDEAPRDNFATQDPTGSPSEGATPPSVPAGPPARYVVLSDGTLELRSTKDGSLIRTLAEKRDGFTRRSLTVSGETAYFVEEPSEDADGCEMRVRSVGFDGTLRTVARGSNVAVSPDGRSLAYVALGEQDCRKGGIVVRDLETGEERSWAWREYPEAYVPENTSVHSLEWHPDSEHLLFGITVGDPRSEFFLLDTSRGGDILDGRELGIANEAVDGGDLSHATFSADGSKLMLVEAIVHEGTQPQSLWWFDVATGKKVERVLHTDLQIDDIALAADGEHVLLGVSEYRNETRIYSTYLFDGEGRPELITDGGGEVAW